MSSLRIRISAAVIFVLAWVQFAAVSPRRESGVLPINPPTPYIHYFGRSPTMGRVLVVHGLDASKEVMSLISSALADGGMDVYAIDLPGHGDSWEGFQVDTAQQAIREAKVLLGQNVMVLGHSLGAGLLLDLAAADHFSTLVLLSPPPIPIEKVNADRILIATGEFDIPRIRSFMSVANDIGEPHVEAWLLPWAAHSSPILNPVYIRRIAGWMGADTTKINTGTRLLAVLGMFVSAVAFGVSLLPGFKIERTFTPASPVLVKYILASGSALLILKFFDPLRWLRLFATDYLISFVLLTGLFLTVFVVKTQKRSISRQGVLRAILSAIYVIAVPGLFIASHVLHMSVSDGRWWRVAFIAIAGLPLFIADEFIIRRIQPGWKAEGIALLTRALFLAFVLTGVLILNREKAFLLLIAPLIVIFWIVLWVAAGVVHRHTQNPFAAAVFSTLVQAWAFASWFVTT